MGGQIDEWMNFHEIQRSPRSLKTSLSTKQLSRDPFWFGAAQSRYLLFSGHI